jgi:hypothetical protein
MWDLVGTFVCSSLGAALGRRTGCEVNVQRPQPTEDNYLGVDERLPQASLPRRRDKTFVGSGAALLAVTVLTGFLGAGKAPLSGAGIP